MPFGHWLLDHAAPLRLVSLLLFVAVFSLAEWLRPRRARTRAAGSRVALNYGLMVMGAAAVRLAIPAGAVGAALWSESTGLGLFHRTALPEWLRWVFAFVLLDVAIYAQHVAFHRVPWLWALHRLHHQDVDLDVSSGVRFHPVEILVSMGWKLLVVGALGLPAPAVLVYEAALACGSIATHSNLLLHPTLETFLRRWLVTPDLHRIHHSVLIDESNRNFGAITPVWDRLFGTFRSQPRDGQLGMRLGVEPQPSEVSSD